jgi:PilZ domain
MANPLPSQLQTREALEAREQEERAEKERGERRIHGRAIGRWAAKLSTPEETFHCVVTDLSLTGARLQLVAQLYRLQEVQFELDGLAPLNAEVMWRTRSNVGIRLTDEPAHIAETIQPVLTLETSKG